MPLDTSVEQQISTDDNGLFKALVSRISEREQPAFSGHQMEVLKSACKGLRWGAHSVDIRLSIPTLFSRYYMVLLAGEERRDRARLTEEKRRHPFNKVANYLFIAFILGLGFYAAIMIEAFLFIALKDVFFG